MGQEKKTENLIKHFLTVRRLNGDKVFFYKIFQNGGNIDGIADIQCCLNGYFVGVEVKALDGIMSDDQKVVANNTIHANGIAILVDDSTDFENWYNAFKKDERACLGKFYNLTDEVITL